MICGKVIFPLNTLVRMNHRNGGCMAFSTNCFRLSCLISIKTTVNGEYYPPSFRELQYAVPENDCLGHIHDSVPVDVIEFRIRCRN